MKMSLLIIGALLALFLNLVWENLQAPLYQGYESFWQHFRICFVASLGDVVIVGAIFGVMALIFKEYWIQDFNLKHLATLLLIGGISAVAVEWWGLHTGRWQYEEMPVIPFLNVGLLPILQMLVIPPVVIYVLKNMYTVKKY